MRTRVHFLVLMLLLASATSLAAAAQEEPPPAQPAASQQVTALQVQVVLSRYQGEKRISRLPYTLAVNTDRDQAQLRMGAEVAIDGPGGTSYRPIGTSIDAAARALGDGRYHVKVAVEDSSLYAGEQGARGASGVAPGLPSFRSFRSTQTVLLRDGQTIEYTTATDKVTGEVMKVEVSLAVRR